MFAASRWRFVGCGNSQMRDLMGWSIRSRRKLWQTSIEVSLVWLCWTPLPARAEVRRVSVSLQVDPVRVSYGVPAQEAGLGGIRAVDWTAVGAVRFLRSKLRGELRDAPTAPDIMDAAAVCPCSGTVACVWNAEEEALIFYTRPFYPFRIGQADLATHPDGRMSWDMQSRPQMPAVEAIAADPGGLLPQGSCRFQDIVFDVVVGHGETVNAALPRRWAVHGPLRSALLPVPSGGDYVHLLSPTLDLHDNPADVRCDPALESLEHVCAPHVTCTLPRNSLGSRPEAWVEISGWPVDRGFRACGCVPCAREVGRPTRWRDDPPAGVRLTVAPYVSPHPMVAPAKHLGAYPAMDERALISHGLIPMQWLGQWRMLNRPESRVESQTAP